MTWLKLEVTTLDFADTVRVLSCANHLSDYLEDYPERLIIQISKLPLSHDNLYHCSHAINAKFGGPRGEWYLRDTEGDWYSTRSYNEDGVSRQHSSKFFNTFKDACGLKFISLKPVEESDDVSPATNAYMGRVYDH